MKKVFFILFILCYSHFLWAQSSFGDLTKIVDVLPPSPTAASLGEFGNLPVGLSTGTPQITVPIYTLNTQNLSLPISLNYSSNGITVDQLSGNVGTGWVLSAGGVISRTVYGNNDESSTWLATPGYLENAITQEVLDYLNIASEISTTGGGTKDNQPDIFSYNFNGYSGKFLYDSAKNIVQLTHTNLKIEVEQLGYKITTPDGVEYFFGGTGGYEQSRTHLSGTCSHEFASYVKTAYYLKKILHPKGDSIIFNYNATSYSYYSGISQTFTKSYNHDPSQWCGAENACPIVTDLSTCPARLSVVGLTLKEIVTSQNDKIVFKNILRMDINDSLVSRVEVYHRKDLANPFVTFYLNYAYSNSGTAYTNTYTLPELKIRPFLISVSEKNAIDSNRYYAFEYNDYDAMPPRLSYAKDDYGFFNGKNNTYLVPPAKQFHQREIFATIPLADRSPSASHGAKGILKKVYYPTKGYDSLIYEGHTTRAPVYMPNPSTPVNISVVGIGNHSAGNAETPAFTLPVPQTITFQFTCATVPGESPNASDNYGVVTVYDKDKYLFDQTILFEETIPLNQTIYISRELDIGNYRVKVTAYGKSVSCSASFGYSAGGNTDDANVNVGGVRIASIKSYDYQSHNVNTKKYYYAASPSSVSVSTGVVVEPIGDYYEDITRIGICVEGAPNEFRTCNFIVAYAGASRNVAGGSGSHIYYSSVLEDFGENFENGGKEYKFLAQKNLACETIRGYRLQGAVMTNIGFRNGLQTEENTFSINGSTVVYKKKIESSYIIDSRVYREINGYIVRKRFNAVDHYNPPVPNEFDGFDVSQYWVNIRWFPLSGKSTTIYDINGNNPITTTVTYTYDNVTHALPTQIKTINSKSESEVVVTNYPSDYANGTTFIDDMKTKYLIGYPIEQVKYREEGLAKKILAGSITQYLSGGRGVKSSEMILETNSPVDLTAFKFSNRFTGVLPNNGTATSFNSDSRYKIRMNYNSYDAANNLQQYSFADNIFNALIWDYQKQYPISEVKNAAITDIAYTSFESDGKGNWTFSGVPASDFTAPSGKKAFTIVNSANNITKSALSTSITYIVSYWKKSGTIAVNGTTPITGKTVNGWTYYEHKVVNPASGLITVSGTNGLIDELRLYPAAAQMTTYTYEPLIGMTSQCDVNNRITYYEYDGFGRLMLIRDQDRNILKKICYNYAGQPESCTEYFNAEQSGTFTRACGPGYTGSSVTYTVPASRYSASSQEAANQLALDDIAANGQSYANENGTCTQTCSFSSYTGFSISSSGISSAGGTVSFYIVFNSSSGTTNWYGINQVATIGGTCKPPSVTVFTMSESDRTWQIVITNTGAFSVQLLGGTPPTGTASIALTGGSFAP